MNNTIKFYDQNADQLSQKYDIANMDEVHNLLNRYISINQNVLDLGFGSGRDLIYLNKKNIQTWGIDGSLAFVERFKKHYPSLEDRVFHSILPSLTLSEKFNSFFDVMFSIATWMHIPKEEHFEVILKLKQYLKSGGIVVLSYSISPRENDPRFFEDLEPEKVALLFESFGFKLIESIINKDGLDRESILWVTQVFKLAASSEKGIDQIESILSQDSKDTTYKYALLKAFSEISSSPLNRFANFSNDYVFFPIGLIAEKWIEMYWKIVDSNVFIPQKKGGEKTKKLAFRNDLENVIKYYRDNKNRTNPYYEFWSDYQKGVSKGSVEYDLILSLFNTIVNTIIVGPVTFSGTSFDDTNFFILGNGAKTFSRRNDEINAKNLLESCTTIGIKRSAYHELYRYGSWISDSIILRWAKFTEKLMLQSGHNESLGEIISLLTADYIHERETTFARKVYDNYQKDFGNLKSVWSAKSLSSYEVDHMMPYSVYYNNDLWNLLPASRSENNAKRDALVSTNLIKIRRNEIIEYWEYMQKQAESKFNNEVYKTLNIDPLGKSWKELMLSAVSEQIEITASIRGLKRWSI